MVKYGYTSFEKRMMATFARQVMGSNNYDGSDNGNSKQINYAPNVVNHYRKLDEQNADRAKFNAEVVNAQRSRVGFGDALGLVDKHFNGGLGYTGVAVNAFNKIPNNAKRHYAHKISKGTGLKSGKIFQNTKGFVNGTGKLVTKLGTAGSVLSGAAITYDLLDDGNLRSSSIVNGALLIIGLTNPVTAPFIIGYGILDYTFDIGDRIDRNFGTVNTGIYE